MRTPCRGSSLLLLLLAACCGSLGAPASVMGEQCDWIGSGLSGGGSRLVTPVYLRCAEGALQWSYPRGALRVVLRLGATGRDFRGCVKASANFSGARVFLEAERSLTPLLVAGERPVARCFTSRRTTAALYVEADPPPAAAPAPRAVAAFTYDLQPLPKGPHAYDPVEECRPCSPEEMTTAFCTSDLVICGIIKSVELDEDAEVSRLRVKVTKRLRQSTEDNVVSSSGDADVVMLVPAHCGARRGSGEFVLMARRKLGELSLVCAPRLDDWVSLAQRDGGSAHCVLSS